MKNGKNYIIANMQKVGAAISFSLLLFSLFVIACSTPTISCDDSEESSSSVSNRKGDNRSSSSESRGSSEDGVKCSALLEEATEWSWDVPKECYFNSDIEYGSMTDSRDGQVYRTVEIGEQTWMAENLNFDPGQGGAGDAKYDWSWCYEDDTKKCAVTGRLYTWAAAIDSVKLATDADNPQNCGYEKTCSLPDTVHGICPSGWHLPTEKEWEKLITNMGFSFNHEFANIAVSKVGKVLKSKTAWKDSGVYGSGYGTDVYGFSALPGTKARNGFEMMYAVFWSASASDEFDAWDIYLYSPEDYVNLNPLGAKYFGFSIRCVKD